MSISRTTHTMAVGAQWPMPLHPKLKSSDNSGSGKRSAINQNESNQPILSNNRTENASVRIQSNNLRLDTPKFITAMQQINHEPEL